MFSERDNFFMQRALQLAEVAAHANEVPVGAVLVYDDVIIGEGYNCPISSNDPTAHAETIALRAAAKHIANYRLIRSKLYVTLEPCMMCAGAMVHARIAQLIYGAADPKAGAISSQAHYLDQTFLNHCVQYHSGLLADQCGAILSRFFKERR